MNNLSADASGTGVASLGWVRVNPLGKAGKEEKKYGRTERGTQSAQHLSPGEGRALWFFTDLYLAKRVSEDTNGAFTLWEVTVPRS